MASAVTVVRQMIRKIVSDFQSDSPPQDVAMAKSRICEFVLEIAKEDFRNLSSGGSVPEGFSWNPTQDGVPILVKTGNLFSSLRSDWIGNRISVTFDSTVCPYAEFATQSRPLWKETYPQRWLELIRSRLGSEIASLIRSRAMVKK